MKTYLPILLFESKDFGGSDYLNRRGVFSTIRAEKVCIGVIEAEKDMNLNLIIGGMQEHQAIKNDGICPCLTGSMGTGGGMYR